MLVLQWSQCKDWHRHWSLSFHLAAVMCHLQWRHMCFFLFKGPFRPHVGPPLHPPESRLTKMSCCEDLTLWKLAAAVINTRKQHWSWGCGGGAAALTLYVGPRAVCAKDLNLGSLTDADFSPLHWGPSLYTYLYVYHREREKERERERVRLDLMLNEVESVFIVKLVDSIRLIFE